MIGLSRRQAGLVFAALALAGCATRPPQDEGSPWISGRLSVRVEARADKPASSVSAGFDLRGTADRGELRLTSPLGTLIANARWAGDGAVLATGQAQTSYPDLESLSREALGEVLPLRAFPDWLAGRPWPGAASTPRADGFDQLGWRVLMARFAEGWVEASRDAVPAVLVRVRLERPG